MDWKEWLLWIFAACLGAAIALVPMQRAAWPHEFYSVECCYAEQDCHPIDAKRVTPIPGGWMLDGRWAYQKSEIKFSPDGRFHACDPVPNVKPRCLYVPPEV